MKLTFRFFDKKIWSYYATINVVIPTVLILILQGNMSTQDLIFVSLMGMMEGNIYSKIIMTGFLNFLVFEPDIAWIKRSMVYVVSIALMDTVKQNNSIHKAIMKSELLQMLMNIIIVLWMGYILYVILGKLYKLYKYGRKIRENRK
tara:strand:+ start:239 stop:676 length:438 start_codon:yes stop_codon:yes gene_type:complete